MKTDPAGTNPPMTDNPTHAELVEAVRIADAFIKAQASRLESQASRIEELEADNKRLADLVVAIREAVRSSGRAALKPARDGV